MIERLISLLAPHVCLGCAAEGSVLCAQCSTRLITYGQRCYKCARPSIEGNVCGSCRRRTPLNALQAAILYDGLSKELAHSLKYGRAKAAAKVMARIMHEHVALPANALIVPAPTATSRVRTRGYDQAVLIARELSRLSGLPYACLLRRNGQQRQVGQTRQKRIVQLVDAFSAKRTSEHKNVVLVDDVTTTGATFEAAAKALKQAGVRRITAIAFAAAPDR